MSSNTRSFMAIYGEHKYCSACYKAGKAMDIVRSHNTCEYIQGKCIVVCPISNPQVTIDFPISHRTFKNYTMRGITPLG